MISSSPNNDKPVGLKSGWRQTLQELVYSCPWFKIRKDQVLLNESKTITYSYLEHKGSVFVVPITRDNEVVLIHSYRYTIDDWSWGVPSGGIHDKLDKTLEECAREEMREEAGCLGGQITSLGWYYTAFGIISLKAHIFLALDVTLGSSEPEAGESIDQIVKVPLGEIDSWIQQEKIRDGESVMAILLAQKWINSQK